jgi:hypothetical protein
MEINPALSLALALCCFCNKQTEEKRCNNIIPTEGKAREREKKMSRKFFHSLLLSASNNNNNPRSPIFFPGKTPDGII